MGKEIEALPAYRSTMELLERAKRTTTDGVEYWLAREIHLLLGYPEWREFESVMQRASDSLIANGIDPSHHFGLTHKKVGLGSGAQRMVEDRFLSRAACYLIAMNGQPSKPEIAAAQAYFVVQTRAKEIEDGKSEEEKRIEQREKVKNSVKIVSGVAKDAGVRSQMQGIFHDQRYQGLYGMSLKSLKAFRGLKDKEQILDRAGRLELSMHDFQMNLAIDVIAKGNIKGEQKAIHTNLSVAKRVRSTVQESGGTMPEKLPMEPPIKEIIKKVEQTKKARSSGSSE